ncbi:MAG: UDP-N-acetylmuramoyl-L-alanyl-D-glutamate--2,6-diaminopimelate ligase [Rhodospirillales bacterium]
MKGIETALPTAPETGRLEITGLAADSRKVEPGFLFAALPGARVDGLAFVGEAVKRGAAAVLAPAAAETAVRSLVARAFAEGGTATPAPTGTESPEASPIAVIVHSNPRRMLALMAARFFGQQPETVCAVTGTNGKTSVVSFLRQIWAHAGRNAASLGTLGLAAPGAQHAGSMTTPDPVVLHRTLADLAAQGVDALAMEASSHGIDQCRLDGVRLAAAAFTNLGRDHLDYHRSIEGYLAAKLRLFSTLVADGGSAVIAADDLASARVRAAAAARGLNVLTYGRAGEHLRLRAIEPIADGQRLSLDVLGAAHVVQLPLVGDFQALNALAAAGLALATGTPTDAVLAALARLEPVPGRLERVGRLRGAPIYVDYAHTPDALTAVLKALRPQTSGRLVVVFGCGGDRDTGKRPEMGAVAKALADRLIVTDDNPRSEDAAAIRRQIMVSCPDADEIGDRTQAIAEAVAGLEAGDVLVVAGKGHETGQIVGARVLPFDDREVVRAVVGGGAP